MTELATSLSDLGDLVALRSILSHAQEAPHAAAGFAARLHSFCQDLRRCGSDNTAEFSQMIFQASALGQFALTQKELARRLAVTPMTLQRWCQRRNLPHAIPRRGYLSELANLGDEIRAEVENVLSELTTEDDMRDHRSLALVAG